MNSKDKQSLDTLEENLNILINKLHDIKAEGLDINEENKTKYLELVSSALMTIKIVSDCLLNSVSDQLSPRQCQVLVGDKTSSAGIYLISECGFHCILIF